MKWKEEEGYAALVAIMVMLVLTIIGTNLLGVVMTSLNQVRKTETRGEAEYFARMGMDEALARLSKVVDDVNAANKNNEDITNTDLYTLYDAGLTNHLFKKFSVTHEETVVVDGVTSKQVWYTSKEPVRNFSSGINGSYQIYYLVEKKQEATEEQPLSHKFTIRVVGKSEALAEEPRTLESVVYVNNYPAEFQYVLSSPKDIFLNGAPYIEGNVIANRILVKNSADYFLNEHHYGSSSTYPPMLTAFPSIVGEVGILRRDSEDNESYFSRVNSSSFYYRDDYGTTAGDFGPPNYNDLDFSHSKYRWFEKFAFAPIFSSTMKPVFTLKDIPTLVGNAKSKFVLGVHESKGALEASATNLRVTSGVKLEKQSPTVNGNVYIERSLVMDKDSTITIKNNGNLFIEGEESLTIPEDTDRDGNPDSVTELVSAATLGGSLVMDKGSFVYIDGNAVIDGLTFDGVMYVNGTLKIQGNFKINGTVYVAKGVVITEDDDSQDFEGVEEQEFKKTLVILAGGDIEAYNLNLYLGSDESKHTPKLLNTFLFSEKAMTLYGIGSNIKLRGGIHSKENITLNAVRGKVTGTFDTGDIDGDGDKNEILSIEGPDADEIPSDPRDSRLQLTFNFALFDSPPDGMIAAKHYNLKITQFELDTFDPLLPTKSN